MMRNPIMDGVHEDLSNLVYQFLSAGKTDFASFVNLWKTQNYCYIYNGRTTIKEMKYFTREILIMAKKLCYPSNGFMERVGGVYIMYSLFYIQPLKLPVRIRIEKDEFRDLLAFVNESNLLEVRYCFYKLFKDHAFDYVYSDKLYSLEMIRERDNQTRQRESILTKEKLDLKGQLEKIWKTVDFDQNKWMETEGAYNKIKTSLNKIGDSTSFDMTEFLKPILTIQEKLYEQDRNKPSSSGAKDTTGKPKKSNSRVKDPVNLLFGDPSSEEEDAVGGSASMPKINLNMLEEDDGEDSDFSP